MKNKILKLEYIKEISIDNLIKLYRDGYILEGPVYAMQKIPKITGTASATFVVNSSDGPLEQASIFVDGEFRGITDNNGKFTVTGLTATNLGTNHPFFILRSGFNNQSGRVILFPDVHAVLPIMITDLTPGKGTMRFSVNCFGRPCEGVTILVKNKEIGKTGPDGLFIAEGIDIGNDIPWTARKEGFRDSSGTVTIIERHTLDSRPILMVQENPKAGEVRFQTVDPTGKPISDVIISIDGNFAGVTDDIGNLTVGNLDITFVHEYIASKPGFVTITGPLDLVIGIRVVTVIMAKSQAAPTIT